MFVRQQGICLSIFLFLFPFHGIVNNRFNVHRSTYIVTSPTENHREMYCNVISVKEL